VNLALDLCMETNSTFVHIRMATIYTAQPIQSPIGDLPIDNAVLSNDFPNFAIPLSLNHTSKSQTAFARMPQPHLFSHLPRPSQIRLHHPRTNTPDFDPVSLELVVIIQHQHIQRRFAAPVPNGFEGDLLRPPGRLRRGGGVVAAACPVDSGESGYEEESWVCRFEQERNECPGRDVGPGHVHVVSGVEAVAE
jgi:hypothetical protein